MNVQQKIQEILTKKGQSIDPEQLKEMATAFKAEYEEIGKRATQDI